MKADHEQATGNMTGIGGLTARTPRRGRSQPRVLAVASGGGHWVQLRRLSPTFDGSDTVWVTTQAGHRAAIGDDGFRTVVEANRWQKVRALRCAAQTFWTVLREWPDAVVTTGALPGFFAVVFGRLFRARTIWIDSIANAEELSMSGRLAERFADVWVTQWPSLAKPDGPYYFGNVMG